MLDHKLVLVGMMGAGKSTVGMTLAKLLDVPFEDTDSILQHKLGSSIKKIFGLYGEEAFRFHETAILKSIERGPGVIATGGGIVLVERNWIELRRIGTVIFLDVPPEQLKERLLNSKRKRPLLEVEDWQEKFDGIYAERRAFYEMADIIFPIELDGLELSASLLKEKLLQLQ